MLDKSMLDILNTMASQIAPNEEEKERVKLLQEALEKINEATIAFEAADKAVAALRATPNALPQCGCDACTARRDIAQKLGISIENVEVMIVEEDDEDEPEKPSLADLLKKMMTR